MLEVQDWQQLEIDVVEALDEYEPPANVVLPYAKSSLRSMDLVGRTGLAIVRVPRGAGGTDLLPKVYDLIGSRGTLMCFQDGGTLVIVIDDSELEPVLTGIGSEAVEGIGSISEVRMELGGKKEDRSHATALILDLLEVAGIRIAYAHNVGFQLEVAVPATQGPRVIALVDGLTRSLLADKLTSG